MGIAPLRANSHAQGVFVRVNHLCQRHRAADNLEDSAQNGLEPKARLRCICRASAQASSS